MFCFGEFHGLLQHPKEVGQRLFERVFSSSAVALGPIISMELPRIENKNWRRFSPKDAVVNTLRVLVGSAAHLHFALQCGTAAAALGKGYRIPQATITSQAANA